MKAYPERKVVRPVRERTISAIVAKQEKHTTIPLLYFPTPDEAHHYLKDLGMLRHPFQHNTYDRIEKSSGSIQLKNILQMFSDHYDGATQNNTFPIDARDSDTINSTSTITYGDVRKFIAIGEKLFKSYDHSNNPVTEVHIEEFVLERPLVHW